MIFVSNFKKIRELKFQPRKYEYLLKLKLFLKHARTVLQLAHSIKEKSSIEINYNVNWTSTGNEKRKYNKKRVWRLEN